MTYVYFTWCPICGAEPTEPGITDHVCDPEVFVNFQPSGWINVQDWAIWGAIKHPDPVSSPHETA